LLSVVCLLGRIHIVAGGRIRVAADDRIRARRILVAERLLHHLSEPLLFSIAYRTHRVDCLAQRLDESRAALIVHEEGVYLPSVLDVVIGEVYRPPPIRVQNFRPRWLGAWSRGLCRCRCRGLPSLEQPRAGLLLGLAGFLLACSSSAASRSFSISVMTSEM